MPDQADDTARLYTAFNAGLQLFGEGRYFDAHEAWEWVWQRQRGRRRTVVQALIQLAAGLYKQKRGNRAAAGRLLAKARHKLDEAAHVEPSAFGIDLLDLGDALRAQSGLSGEGSPATAPQLPESTGPDGFVYLHGFASGPSSTKAARIVPALRQRGHAVAVPDLNDGDFRGLTVSRALAQARRLVRDRTIVIGSSFGGYLAALLARADDRVRALVLMAPAFELAARLEARHGADAMARWRKHGSMAVEHYAYGGLHELDVAFLDDARRHPARPALDVPTYILQGAGDDVVPAAMVREVAAASPDGVRLDVVDDDHGLVASAERALEAAIDFANGLGFGPDPVPTDADAVLASLANDPPLASRP